MEFFCFWDFLSHICLKQIFGKFYKSFKDKKHLRIFVTLTIISNKSQRKIAANFFASFCTSQTKNKYFDSRQHWTCFYQIKWYNQNYKTTIGMNFGSANFQPLNLIFLALSNSTILQTTRTLMYSMWHSFLGGPVNSCLFWCEQQCSSIDFFCYSHLGFTWDTVRDFILACSCSEPIFFFKVK